MNEMLVDAICGSCRRQVSSRLRIRLLLATCCAWMVSGGVAAGGNPDGSERPVVFDGPAESAIAHWIREGDTGWILPDDQSVLPAGILDSIRERELIASKGKNARLQANQLFDHEINTMKIVRLLEEIGSRGG